MAGKQQPEKSINNDGNEVPANTQTINNELQLFINSKVRTGQLLSGKKGDSEMYTRPGHNKQLSANPSYRSISKLQPKQTNTIDFTNIISEKDIPTTLEEVIIDNESSTMGNSSSSNSNISRELQQFVRTSPHVNRAFRIKKISSKNPRSLLKKKYVYIFEDPIIPEVQQQIIIPQELINKTLLKKKNIPKIIVPSSQSTVKSNTTTTTTGTTTTTTTTTSTTTTESSAATITSTETIPSDIISPLVTPTKTSIPQSDNVLIKKDQSIKGNIKIPKQLNCLVNAKNIVNNSDKDDDTAIKLKSPKNYYPNYNRNDSLLNNTKFKALHNKFKIRKKFGASAVSSMKKSSKTATKITKKPREIKSKKQKKLIDLHGANITINHGNDGETTTVMETDQIVNINKNEDDDESEDIDIMNDADEIFDTSSTSTAAIIGTNTNANITAIPSIVTDNITVITTSPDNNNTIAYLTLEIMANLKNYSKELQEKLQSHNVPTEELEICVTSEIGDVEKYFFSEFFDCNSTAKTPTRYKTIRNYILSTWKNEKPKYLNKIAIRFGLKHCGDVNCISRIHSLLEQLGAINFGHHKDQFEFIRPLTKLKAIFSQSNRTTKCIATDIPSAESRLMQKIRLPRMPRSCTTSSDDHGTSWMIQKTPLKLPSTIGLTRIARIKESRSRLELIECLKFNDNDMPPPFTVSITLSTILCLQLHSLSVKYEIMGFLGGHFSNTNPTTALSSSSSSYSQLYITRYKPCRTSVQTTSTCEMCPISQVVQSEKLTAEGYDLLGWFHSHPTFAPNPSKTDIETQNHMQKYLFNDVSRPFVGFILSCLDFSYKCIFINKSINEVPYEMSIEIIKDCSNITNEIIDVFNILDRNDLQYQSNINKFKQEAEKLLIENGYSRDVLSFMKDFE